jgi:hypothetical protein
VPDMVADLRRSLTQRLETIERKLIDVTALTSERDRIRAALDALGPATKTPTGRSANGATGRRTPTPRKRPNAAAKRAKPGENTAKVLAVIGERPGVSAVEISQVAKLSQPTTYTTISRLAKSEKIEEVELGSGRGWRVKDA